MRLNELTNKIPDNYVHQKLIQTAIENKLASDKVEAERLVQEYYKSSKHKMIEDMIDNAFE